jgi:hypothetical protein
MRDNGTPNGIIEDITVTYFSGFLKIACVPLLPLLIFAVLTLDAHLGEANNNSSEYTGSFACKPCHEKEYNSFIQYSKKAKSFESVEKMRKGLTEEEIRKCYFCHTTGYGRGGFVSPEKTPHLKNTGCEVCHGPGGVHVKTRNPRDIKRHLTMDDCARCHIAERVRAFRYKPLIHGGGH